MIAVSVDFQLQGLGRCWSTAVVHNNVYLECPTTKSLHVYRCKSGFINMVIGHGANGIPIPVARQIQHEDGRTTVEFSTTQEVASSYVGLGKAAKDGWSNELALQATPNVCQKFVSMILMKKEKDDFYKLMAEMKINRKIEVKYLKATDAYEFFIDGREVDLEHVLQLLRKLIMSSQYDVNYTWRESDYQDKIDDFIDYVTSTIKSPVQAED